LRSKPAERADESVDCAPTGAHASAASSRQRQAFNYDPTSLRREYSAMRIPKPARSVTTELPP
jgi:hypothetical protein